jgi:hypothetical protein
MNQPLSFSANTGLLVYYLFDRHPLEMGSKMLSASKRVPENVNNEDVVFVRWAVPKWRQRIEMSESCKIYDPIKMEYSIDSMSWRDKWLKKSLVEWDLKNKDGTPVPLVDSNIDELPAELIDYFIIGYESVSEDEDRSVGKAWRRSATS